MTATVLLNNLVVIYGVIVYILVFGIIVYCEKKDKDFPMIPVMTWFVISNIYVFNILYLSIKK